jgi:hypothetical protein
MYLNRSLLSQRPSIGVVGKFEENLMIVNENDREYFEDDALRNIAIVYKRMKKFTELSIQKLKNTRLG